MVTLKEILRKNTEVKKAIESYPFLEPEGAYKLWKEDRNENPLLISQIDTEYIARKEIAKLPSISCDCGGKVIIETICSDCNNFRFGYRTKAKCLKCKREELSKSEFLDRLIELYPFLKP